MTLQDWFSDLRGPSFTGIGEYFEGEPPELPLDEILNINEQNLKPLTTALLGRHELPPLVSEMISEISWAIRAYVQFMDIQEVTLDLITPMLNRHFCYYESIVYLRESVVSWMDGNVLAAFTLLRPYMELSVLHLYWYFKGQETDYSAYYEWLEKGKGKPPFRNLYDQFFEKVPSRASLDKEWVRDLRGRLWESYRVLCSYNHTPTLVESITARNKGYANPSFTAFMDCHRVTLGLVRDLVLLYVIAFPLCLYPIDIYRKWAFSGPVGIFLHPMGTSILKKFLGQSEFSELECRLVDAPHVKDKLEWANSQLDISDQKILADWERFAHEEEISDPVSSPKEAIARERAFRRALSWQLNYVEGRLEKPIAS